MKINSNDIGVGLRSEHYTDLENSLETNVNWFEALTENHLDSKGRPFEILERVRQQYPLSFHGVSLSIAGHEELRPDYLKRLKEFYDYFEPEIISDHLCWTGLNDSNFHNLLPFAFTKENLNFLSDRINYVQDFLNRQISLENLSAYFDYKKSEMTEWEFIANLLKKSGHKQLLDVNNIYVNSKNHKFDPKIYIDAIPTESISHIHLAGFTDMGEFLFDTHSNPVFDEVWDLYRYTISTKGAIPTLIEWDEDIPSFEILQNEALKAKEILLGK